MVERILSFRLPWVALGGGGYDLSNVARSWALAWAIMNNVSAPNEIPAGFVRKNSDIFRNGFLRDTPITPFTLRDDEIKTLEADLYYLNHTVLPLMRDAKEKLA